MRANRQFHLSALPRYILTARLPYETPVKTPQKILPMIETVRYVHFVLRLKTKSVRMFQRRLQSTLANSNGTSR